MVQRLQPGPRMSAAVSWPLNGRALITAGQVARDSAADIGGQTRDVLEQIDGLLAQAGFSKADVVSAQVWLSDIALFDGLNQVWDGWVTPGHTPARACVEAKLADPELLVEIQVQAVKGDR